jgi:hypothetical protein
VALVSGQDQSWIRCGWVDLGRQPLGREHAAGCDSNLDPTCVWEDDFDESGATAELIDEHGHVIRTGPPVTGPVHAGVTGSYNSPA